ncbi:MAG: response regulator [Gemmatimonadaceae bacterium]
MAGAHLIKQDERVNALANSIDHIVWSTDASGVFDFANARWEEYTRQSLSAADRSGWLALLHPDDRRRTWAAFQEAIATGTLFECEYRLRRWDGEYRWHLSRGAPQRSEHGVIKRWIGTSTDVDDLKRADAAQKMEAVRRLAGGIAHDLNNVLTVIKGHAEFLSRDIAPSGESREDLEQIIKSAHHAANVTRQLLAFSRQQVMEKQVHDANELLRDLERVIARLIGGDILLSLSLSDSAMVFADASQVEQAIMNLVINARDSMPQGGSLRLATRAVVLDSNEASRHPEARPGEYVAIDVSDTGKGIEPDLLVKIFEPFFTTKDPGKSTGLGLATVYGIAQQSGGFVDVDSLPGSGSTFTLYVPVAAASAAIPPAAPGGSKPGNELILLVEDQDEVRRVASRILTARGYRVVEARNGIEALALLKAPDSGVDLVLTDAVMPLMSGTDLVRALRANNPAMPVIIASGFTDPELVSYCTGKLKVRFLGKPFRSDELVRIVRETIGAAVPGD